MYQNWLKEFARNITTYGSFEFQVSLVIVFYIIKQTTLSKQILFGLILTYSICSLIRLVYFTNRPKKLPYSNIIERIYASSFPSVHATNITCLGVILMFYLKNIYFHLVVIAVISLVASSRVYLEKHYVKDILAGIVLGVVEAIVITYLI